MVPSNCLLSNILQFNGRWDKAELMTFFDKSTDPPVVVILLKTKHYLLYMKWKINCEGANGN